MKRIRKSVAREGDSSRVESIQMERSSVKSHARTLSISIPVQSIPTNRLISTNTTKFCQRLRRMAPRRKDKRAHACTREITNLRKI